MVKVLSQTIFNIELSDEEYKIIVRSLAKTASTKEELNLHGMLLSSLQIGEVYTCDCSGAQYVDASSEFHGDDIPDDSETVSDFSETVPNGFAELVDHAVIDQSLCDQFSKSP